MIKNSLIESYKTCKKYSLPLFSIYILLTLLQYVSQFPKELILFPYAKLLFIIYFIASSLTHWFFFIFIIFLGLHDFSTMKAAFKNYIFILKTRWKLFLKAYIANGLYVVIGLLMFVIPGIDRFVKYSFITRSLLVESESVNAFELSKTLAEKTFGVLASIIFATIIFNVLLGQLGIFLNIHNTFLFIALINLLGSFYALFYTKIFLELKKTYGSSIDPKTVETPYPTWSKIGELLAACIGLIVLWFIGVCIIQSVLN